MATDDEPAYIDYEAFLSPSFSPVSFANSLVLSTNTPSEVPQDLSTPLSKVLFDVQEVDTHIDTLTTKDALPLLEYTKERAQRADIVLDEVEKGVGGVKAAMQRLREDVIVKEQTAREVKTVALRLIETIRLGKVVGRVLMLGRQLELQTAEGQEDFNASSGQKSSGDLRSMVRAATTLATIRTVIGASRPGDEGYGIDQVDAIAILQRELLDPTENILSTRSKQIIREFSMSSLLAAQTSSSGQPTGNAPSYVRNEETKTRAASAILILYYLSPATSDQSPQSFEPELVISTLTDYLRTALKSSLAALSRSLATLPTLDRTLLEVAARCQNILALEWLLSTIKPPPHPAFELHDPSAETSSDSAPGIDSTPSTILQTLLSSLDTSSLPSFFWRSLASALSPRVQDILAKGGVSARTLRSNKDRVREAVRNCVDRGSQLPGVSGAGKSKNGGRIPWEREAAVMVGAIVGPLGR